MKKLNPLALYVCVVAFCCACLLSAAQAQTFQTVSTFSGANGAVPTDTLVQGSDGNLYGTTQAGGSANAGSILRVTPAGTMKTLYSFCKTSCLDGRTPVGGLVQGTDGNYYGTTLSGGAYQGGTIFKITPSGSLTTLYSFCKVSKCADGQSPHAGLVQGRDGNFYGTTQGGPSYAGNVFKMTPSGALTSLYTFCLNCASGSSPEGDLIQATDGNFYGTTSMGGLGSGGTIFRITPSGTFTTLYSFCSLANCKDGSMPYGALVQGTDGNLYGTTVNGGKTGNGTAFQLTTSGQLNTLYSFCSLANCVDGQYPYGELVQGRDGSFYGTTESGGAKTNGNVCALGCGTLFQLTPAGSLTTVYNFCSTLNCADGVEPFAGVVQASNATFYGTAAYGGACTILLNGCGTIFGWSPNVALPPVFQPTSVSYGNHAVNTSKQRSIAIVNNNSGYAILDISSITLTGSSDFTITSNTCTSTLAAGHECTVFVTFTPTIIGSESATLNVFDNAPGSPQTALFSGAGVAQAALTPTSVAFPKTKVGSTSNPKTLYLKNNLPTTLTGISYKTTGPFAVSSTTCGTTLASNTNCTFSVVFKPTVTGAANGTLAIKDSANNSPQTSTLTGTGY
ncbi:MAG TPA: choice-of-anchor tandem repeat GloVer-containing protein [Candidatus Eisenbacteria bacterium]|nr:choice-of-anchor tandem repeat GloVer-containing protein [Candidatus Eisenbacteria bacterium]